MLIKRYYVVYARVPLGYPGVSTITVPEWYTGKQVYEAAKNCERCAILYILEAK